jgi:hypothetical protein
VPRRSATRSPPGSAPSSSHPEATPPSSSSAGEAARRPACARWSRRSTARGSISSSCRSTSTSTAAFLDTALYGTFPLESWLARPLALYIRLARGRKRGVDIAIGEAPGDPVLAIPDVPIHLARKVQARENPVAEPERMDAYAGVSAAAVAKALRAHGLSDADLVEAEAYLVPAGPAALVGVDRAMVAGYAQTRLALAYLATRALADATGDQATLAVILVSKSQVENTGATGVGFVSRAFSRALSAESGELDVLASRRAHARSALLVAATGTGDANAGIIVSPTGDDALPGALRRALDRFARAGVPTQIGTARSDAAVELGSLDLDAVAVSLPVKSPGAPLEICSALDLHYGLVALASWFAP